MISLLTERLLADLGMYLPKLPRADPHVGDGGRPWAQHLAAQVVALAVGEVVELSHNLGSDRRDCSERLERQTGLWVSISPITSSLTEEKVGSTSRLLVAVQDTVLPWSLLEMWEMRTVLLTCPLALSTSSPTAGRGTLSFLQTMVGVGSPPSVVQYSLTSPPRARGCVLSPSSAPAWLYMTGWAGLATTHRVRPTLEL